MTIDTLVKRNLSFFDPQGVFFSLELIGITELKNSKEKFFRFFIGISLVKRIFVFLTKLIFLMIFFKLFSPKI